MPEAPAGPSAGSSGTGDPVRRGGRRPGTRARRVVAGPTGAPGDPEEGVSAGAAGSDLDDRDSPGPASAWEAEAERLRRDRPPHWG